MGIFSRREKAPVPIGQSLCLLTPEGGAYVNQMHRPDMAPEAIALLAPITMAMQIGIETASTPAGQAAFRKALGGLTRCEGPDELNVGLNPGGVHPTPTGFTPEGTAVGVMGSFSLLPTSMMTGSWQGVGEYSPTHSFRVLGALWKAAEWLDVDRAVWHAWYATSTLEHGFDDPQIPLSLPQIMVDHGVEMAALDALKDQSPWDGTTHPVD